MPRTYKPEPGKKRYKKHSEDDLKSALNAIGKGMSYRKASEKYKISKTVLNRHKKNPKMQPHGGQPALGDGVEKHLVDRLIVCGQWGYPLDRLDMRLIVKGYLDRRGMKVVKFENNMPGVEWANSFLKRHNDKLAKRMCQNIKRNRAAVSPNIVNEYFDNLDESLKDIPPSNIMNYDETNLSDDPGRKQVIMKRGTKYPERIMNSTKSSTSLMYAGCADGALLPPYVVYKATNMYDTWTVGGPAGARYNRSKSGWFDLQCFSDWFESLALPHLKKLPGRKVLIGDNLSSHLSAEVIKMCEENNISFCFLPPNSTHLVQPLDVAFFRPMKTAWRKTLEKWKKGPGRKQSSIPKDTFPQLLKTLTTEIEANTAGNLKAGFEKCGIVPLNRKKVLQRLPAEAGTSDDGQTNETAAGNDAIDNSFTDLLKQMRYDTGDTQRKRKRKVNVKPGKSVIGADLQVPVAEDDSADENVDDDQEQVENDHDGACGNEQESDENMEDEEPRCSTSSDTQGRKLNRISKKICVRSRDVERLGKGDFVIFLYEGEQFPGKVTLVKEDECEISSMQKSGQNWKWPNKVDVLFYSKKDIEKKIEPPNQLKRGVFEIQELKDRWG